MPNYSKLRRINLIVFTILVFLFLGALLGIRGGSFFGESSSDKREEQSSSQASNTSIQSNRKVWFGKVSPASDYGYIEGTHVILDERGDIFGLLKARDDKLFFVEGQLVEVEGKVKGAKEADIDLMTVEFVRFK